MESVMKIFLIIQLTILFFRMLIIFNFGISLTSLKVTYTLLSYIYIYIFFSIHNI